MKENKRPVYLVFRIILIIAGVFFLLILFSFHPDDSLYFNNKILAKTNHFLGKTGANTAGFLFYFLGRASFLFSIFLIYTGYILLKKLSAMKKIEFSILAFTTIITSMILFSLIDNDILYKGGGIFGRSISNQLTLYVNRKLLLIIFISLLTGELFFLFKPPVKGICRGISGLLNRLEALNSRDTFEHSNIKEYHSEKTKSLFRKRPRSIKKPPLIRRVYYDRQGNLLKPVLDADSAEDRVNSSDFDNKVISQRIDLFENSMGSSVNIEKNQKSAIPDVSLLEKSKVTNNRERERVTIKKARELEKTLADFDIDAKVSGIIRGPVITRYELQPAPGVKLSRIVNLSDNIALSLSAKGVRIEAPIPGRSAVGIEIPNDMSEIVTLGDIIEEAEKAGELPLILGKDIAGKVVTADLTEMPHLLIAGATGSGKSVCINSLIVSLLFQKKAENLRFIMIDPKMVELKIYNGIPHLLTEVVTDPRYASKALRWVIYEMENRYQILDKYYARDIKAYNQKVAEKMPYIVVIVDEFANLMAISQKEVEDACVRLASMSRAVGIHLIMSTQRPSVDVITGLIKANFPYRIAFQVASKTDSRTILDYSGAEKLLGRGDMLFSPAGSTNIQRIQGAFISDEELLRIINSFQKRGEGDYNLDILSFDKEQGYNVDDSDPIFDEAVEIVLKTKRASASFLQRRLKIGYNRAARLIELMEEKGIIGPPRGSKPREIYIERVD